MIKKNESLKEHVLQSDLWPADFTQGSLFGRLSCRWFIVRTVGRLLMLNPSHFMTAKMPFFLPMWTEAKRQNELRMINDDYRERWVADGLVCGWQTKTGAMMPTTLGRSCQGWTSPWGCQSKVSCKHLIRLAPTRNLALNENELVLASLQNQAQLREFFVFSMTCKKCKWVAFY